jgi:NADP-dependent 3-hydroxy acid dehydrogenase YdfG
MELDGSVVVVTGGSSGIGLATVETLARQGAQVVALGRDRARLEAAVDGLSPDVRPRVHWQCVDVREEAAVGDGVQTLSRRFGRIDALVNAAGTSMRARVPLADTSPSEWRLLLETNLTGTYLMCRAVVPRMVRAGGGEIVNIGSTAAFRSQPGNSLYSASKYGVRALTEALAEEHRETGVRVTSVSPGPVDTNIWNRKVTPPPPETRARMLRAGDIAEIVRWLLTLPASVQVDNITVTPRPAGHAS